MFILPKREDSEDLERNESSFLTFYKTKNKKQKNKKQKTNHLCFTFLSLLCVGGPYVSGGQTQGLRHTGKGFTTLTTDESNSSTSVEL